MDTDDTGAGQDFNGDEEMSEQEIIENLNIYQRLDRIRTKVPYIKKEKQVESYKAVEHDAVTAAVRPFFIEYGVMVVPREQSSVVVITGTHTKGGTPIIRFEAKYEIDFVNIDKPEDKATVEATAHALDHGDKAPGKAMSYATKTAILKILSIETGLSDESRVESASPYTNEQKERFDGLLAEKNAIEFFAFTNALDMQESIALFSSFPKGDKTKLKAIARELEAEGVKQINDYAESLAEAADKEDAMSVEQLTSEMSYDVKKAVWSLLDKDHKDKLSIMKEAKNEPPSQ